ncbi:MAG: hypothetical protein KKC80_07280 [Candidatus Margulisbacteria bacterium]|nr:hypothetical protein [Candidatus Margulisiibacteriota bacterium]
MGSTPSIRPGDTFVAVGLGAPGPIIPPFCQLSFVDTPFGKDLVIWTVSVLKRIPSWLFAGAVEATGGDETEATGLFAVTEGVFGGLSSDSFLVIQLIAL